jgi:YVTN family beta-propeller protein
LHFRAARDRSLYWRVPSRQRSNYRAKRLHHELRLQNGIGDQHRDQRGDRHDPRRQPSRGRGGDPDGSKVYVANFGDSTVSVIATATNTVIGSPILVGGNIRSVPVGLAVTPDGSKVYVANSGDSTVSVIATASDTVIGSPIPGLIPGHHRRPKAEVTLAAAIIRRD